MKTLCRLLLRTFPSRLVRRSGALLMVFGAVLQAAVAGPAVNEAAVLVARSGNTEDEAERLGCLRELASLSSAPPTLRADAASLVKFVERWSTSPLKFYSKEPEPYDFKLSPVSPLRPLASLYAGRMMAWKLIENSTLRSHPKEGPAWHRRTCEAFRQAAEAFPGNRIPRMYLGEFIPWPKEFGPVLGAPEWAVLQREQLERLRDIILWWVEHRQRPDGSFGGGWGDDCEMWRWWAPVQFGFDDEQITAAQLKFSHAALSKPHLKGGFNTEVTDVEHAAEDTTDNLVPLLVLDSDNQKWQDWSLSLTGFMESVWTGDNERGRRQFKSFYFSATQTSPAPSRALDVIANVGALHPAILAWQRTGDNRFEKILTSWLDTWVEATAREEGGKPAGILPASIRWPDGQVAGSQGNWWEPVKPGGFMHSYYIWPSVLTEMTDAMVLAYVATRNEKYLQPIRSMAAIRLKHLKAPPKEGDTVAAGSEAWCAGQLGPRANANSNVGGLVKTLARLKALTGTVEFDEILAMDGGESVVEGDPAGRARMVEALRLSGEALRVNFPGFTSEVRSTDRVMRFVQFLATDYRFDEYKGVTLPKHELLYRMVTGDRNAPRLPQMAVRWMTPPQDIAVLVTAASTSVFEAEVFHFGKSPRPLTALLSLLAPGDYEVDISGEANGVGTMPSQRRVLKVSAGQAASLPLTVPSRKLCLLKIKRAVR